MPSILCRLLLWILLCGLPLSAAEQVIIPAKQTWTVGEPLVVLIGDNPYSDRECALLLYDSFARLVGVRLLPPVAPPAAVDPEQNDAADDTEAQPRFTPFGQFWFRTDGLAPGPLKVKFACRDTVGDTDGFVVHQTCTVNLQSTVNAKSEAPANPLSLWTPEKTLQFWRATPLAVDIKLDWERLLTDTELTGAAAPCDGPTLVLPRGTVLSSRMITTEIEPLLARRGLLICETWPTPSLDDAIDLSTIVSPTAPVVKLPDIRPIVALTGLNGPAILSDPDPAQWLERDRHTRLLARRDPAHHRLFGLVEDSFCCLTTRLKPSVGTLALRYAADGSPAVTLRLAPSGGAVLVLNAAVQGYAAAAAQPARAVDILGLEPARARELLTGARGGIALRDALHQVRRLLQERRAAVSETGPYFVLQPEIRRDDDRCLFLIADCKSTNRTLPGWMPPNGIAVRLLRHGELQQQGVMTYSDNRYLSIFRIPLDAPADGWTLAFDDPFSGEAIVLAVDLPPTADIKVFDQPAS